MKYAPKKVFILENGKYKEIKYSELQKLEQSDKSYAEKFFLPLYGMLMEVTAETYKAYYKDNVSAIDRGSGLVVIKPSGVSYDDMKPEDMVVVDLDGHIVEGSLKGDRREIPSVIRYAHTFVFIQSVCGRGRHCTYAQHLCNILGASRKKYSCIRNNTRRRILRQRTVRKSTHQSGSGKRLRTEYR